MLNTEYKQLNWTRIQAGKYWAFQGSLYLDHKDIEENYTIDEFECIEYYINKEDYVWVISSTTHDEDDFLENNFKTLKQAKAYLQDHAECFLDCEQENIYVEDSEEAEREEREHQEKINAIVKEIYNKGYLSRLYIALTLIEEMIPNLDAFALIKLFYDRSFEDEEVRLKDSIKSELNDFIKTFDCEKSNYPYIAFCILNVCHGSFIDAIKKYRKKEIIISKNNKIINLNDISKVKKVTVAKKDLETLPVFKLCSWYCSEDDTKTLQVVGIKNITSQNNISQGSAIRVVFKHLPDEVYTYYQHFSKEKGAFIEDTVLGRFYACDTFDKKMLKK